MALQKANEDGEKRPEQERKLARRFKRSYSDVTDPNIGRIRRQQRSGAKEVSTTCSSWESDWFEVATELCRVDDGLPAELDGFKLTKAGHRTQRLKALGNSIVPQVAIQIMKAINLL